MRTILDFGQFEALNEGNIASSASSAAASVGSSLVSKGNILKRKKLIDQSEYWTLITIIACENFPDNKQGMSDTAQSIYNRLAVPKQPYGKTIKEIILAKGQYQPVSVGTKKGADWKNINSKEKSISAYMKTKGVDKTAATTAINNAIQAQKDSKLAKEAGKHVQSRTEFLASKPQSGGAVSPVERTSPKTNNAFFWNYAGKTNFYAKKDTTPKDKPDSVNLA